MKLLQRRMVLREISLDLFLALVTVVSTCIPAQCIRCNITGETTAGSNNTALCRNDTPQNCSEDFQVSVNSTGSNVEEGDDVTLTCVHNLTNFSVIFAWKKDGEEISKGENQSQLVLDKVFSGHSGHYTCAVNSTCGIYESSPHGVTVNNRSVVLIVVCGASALLLIFVVSLAMKFKLKRENAQHRERMKQKAQAEQRAAPAPFTPRQL